MGAWGPKLYQCDDAEDIALEMKDLVRIPMDGPELLELLNEQYPYDDPEDDTASIICITLADQFYLYDIHCAELFEDARQMIISGRDNRNMAELGMSEKDLAARRADLNALLKKWESPNPKPRNRRIVKTPQKHAVTAGDIWIFPTEERRPAPTGCTFKEIETYFNPDGWSAFLIGRTWHRLGLFSCAYCILLDIDGPARPTLEQCMSAAFAGELCLRLAPDPRPKAQWAPVTQTVLKKMQAEKLVSIPLDLEKMRERFNLDDPDYDPPAIENALFILEVKVYKHKEDWLLRAPTAFGVRDIIANGGEQDE